MSSGNSSDNPFGGIINGDAGKATSSNGITTKAFALNLATGLALFAFELTGFFLLKSSGAGRRIYQPKTYLVQDRLRVEAIPVSPWKWIRRVVTIKDEELKAKCGLDGYFFIRFIRAMMVIFVPMTILVVPILFPINYNGGAGTNTFEVGGHPHSYNVTGLNVLSFQNVAPTQTNRYWAHLVCACLAIAWTLYRIYREKLHFIAVRQEYLTSPEHRLKASARTVLVTNIPSEYRSNEALKALFDVFVDNDDRSKLTVWVNRDYKSLRALSARRRKLCHALEKEELKILRSVNKQYRKVGSAKAVEQPPRIRPLDLTVPSERHEVEHNDAQQALQHISKLFDEDCKDHDQLWRKYLKKSDGSKVKIIEDDTDSRTRPSSIKFWKREPTTGVPKIAWLRAEIARLNVQIDEILQDLDDETQFKKQNSAFVQFDRQMSAHMAFALTTHHHPGIMSPRFLDVAPHEVVWPNMGLTTWDRFVRACIAVVLFVGMIILWGIPATFLGIISQLESVRYNYTWLYWLRPWPNWLISLISGPVAAILLALLIQLVVPALCRKLAVLVGSPTRSKREVNTQTFYFTFLFIELVLVTSISSGLVATIGAIINNPTTISSTLATDLPKAANYFFNYLIIQALGFSGSVLFQYLRLLYITMIWPWFTQTPREEAWLQTTIPHQMWGNVYSLFTNFAAIGMIYSIISPLVLIFISIMFFLFWIAYRHNYYYVQRNKVDTHGLLFEHALSLLYTGIYVMEIALIGLFFLVRNSADKVACTPQAIIMIVVLVLTGIYHYVTETLFLPLRELLPVTLEDSAAEAERRRFISENDNTPPNEEQEVKQSVEQTEEQRSSSDTEKPQKELPLTADGGALKILGKSIRRRPGAAGDKHAISRTADNARRMLSHINHEREVSLRPDSSEGGGSTLKKREAQDQLGAAIAGYPDELTDLSRPERSIELEAAYQDPVTRESAPIIWIPQDPAGVSDDTIEHAKKWQAYVQYSNSGAFLARNNKCVVTQPAPDVRSDWLLTWFL